MKLWQTGLLCCEQDKTSDPEQFLTLGNRCVHLASMSFQWRELEKNNLETQLNEVNTFENTWTKLLQGCIKHDFSYGQVQQ